MSGRFRSPGGSPAAKRRQTASPSIFSSPTRSPTVKGGDRFIPSRSACRNLSAQFAMLKPAPNNANANVQNNAKGTSSSLSTTSAYNLILQNELLPVDTPLTSSPLLSSSPTRSPARATSVPPSSSSTSQNGSPYLNGSKKRNLLSFSSPVSSAVVGMKKRRDPYSLSPIGEHSKQLLAKKYGQVSRKIPKEPFKTLLAPSIQDDFYLNLVDWSSQNVLAVGLSSSIFLWNASTSQGTRLAQPSDPSSPTSSPSNVTSVSWMERGTHLATGTQSGFVQIWDVSTCQCIRELAGHRGRVGALSWNSSTLTSGSRDRTIRHWDYRSPGSEYMRLAGHKQEVCGLKWSWDGTQLATGGNDNRLFVWEAGQSQYVARFDDHVAAVKAIAWSPHQRGLLASGGGTADRTIRLWNTLTKTPVCCIDTGSQVCNLAWSKNVNELVSTHGFSQNQVILWSYPTMTPIATLTGHTMRVLYLAVSPDGQTVVTGAGDGSLRFWNVFPSAKDKSAVSSEASSLYHRTSIR